MRHWLVAPLALFFVACGGSTGSTPDAGSTRNDAGTPPADATAPDDAGPPPADATVPDDASDADAWVFHDAATVVCRPDAAPDASSSCRDDRPVPGTPFAQTGPCVLPDGGIGYGRGEYGCIDPTECDCKPGAGCVACLPGADFVQKANDVGRTVHCVYASCGPANEDDSCLLPGGKTGVCCKETCVDPASFQNDPNNCGYCGVGCGQGACIQGSCNDCGQGPCLACKGVVCQTGTVCAAAWCQGTNCSACLQAGCSSQPEGSPCALSTASGPSEGTCCGGVCVNPTQDNQNCGGCGISCCPGSQCSGGVSAFDGVCL
jgi:hypothetical protein